VGQGTREGTKKVQSGTGVLANLVSLSNACGVGKKKRGTRKNHNGPEGCVSVKPRVHGGEKSQK